MGYPSQRIGAILQSFAILPGVVRILCYMMQDQNRSQAVQYNYIIATSTKLRQIDVNLYKFKLEQN